MSYHGCSEQWDLDDNDEDDFVTCNRCGADDLHWERTWSKAARCDKWLLHNDDDTLHVCSGPDVNDVFDDLTETDSEG
ncbi:MAG: hypothetical protein V4787_11535 [Pseudomonadota bacterium]